MTCETSKNYNFFGFTKTKRQRQWRVTRAHARATRNKIHFKWLLCIFIQWLQFITHSSHTQTQSHTRGERESEREKEIQSINWRIAVLISAISWHYLVFGFYRIAIELQLGYTGEWKRNNVTMKYAAHQIKTIRNSIDDATKSAYHTIFTITICVSLHTVLWSVSRTET